MLGWDQSWTWQCLHTIKTNPVKVEAVTANYGSYSVHVEGYVGVVSVNEPAQVHSIDV